MNKTIVVDLDGVVANIITPLSEIFDGENYSQLILLNQYENIEDDFLFWKNLQPFEDSWHQVNKWFSDAHDVHLVSDRASKKSRLQIDSWLDGWRINTMIPIQAIFESKCDAIKELDPDIVIDDNPFIVKSLINDGINAILRQAWYNQDSWDILPTVRTLYEVTL